MELISDFAEKWHLMSSLVSISASQEALVKPYIVTKCVGLLQACATSVFKLKQVHAFSIRHGAPISNPELGKHLIFCSVALSLPMSYAHSIFAQLKSPNIFAWNTMIRGYAESNNPWPAVEIHEQMRLSGIEPDTHTYPFLLKAVGKVMNVRVCEKVHSVIVRNGYESLVFVQNAMVHVYAACGRAESAHKLFVLMPEKCLVAWNSVINGFALNGKPDEALRLYTEMGVEECKPDGFTIVSLLSACAELGALALGRRVHMYMVKVGLTTNLHATNALIDLYAKCGSIVEARKVFDEMGERSVVSWTSLIVGLALNGFGQDALSLFQGLENERLVPSEITFVGALYACSHCGMVDKGFEYFKRMKEEFGIKPNIEHYGCMVDLLGRAGLVRDAYKYIQDMPIPPNAVIWRMLLGACAMHKNIVIGEIARAQLQILEPGHSGDYVLISNLYASERRWSDVHKVRRKMVRDGVRKAPGHSYVELGNCIHEFVMGDKSHVRADEIYKMLEEIMRLLKLQGYAPHTENVHADIEEEEKEDALNYHSEKIAIAFALISTPPKSPIRVVKNLRVCGDCHLAIKLISTVYEREIIVRDRSRFHYFKEGSCSCNEYW